MDSCDKQQIKKRDNSTSPKQENPRLCANDCGFYGTSATNNLCSKCFKDYCLKNENSKSDIAAKPSQALEKSKSDAAKPSQPLETAKSDTAAKSRAFDNLKNSIPSDKNTKNIAEASTVNDNVSSASVVSVTKNRCLCCKKKVGLIGFSCRCGGNFCKIHRFPEEHSCKFDFKTAARVALATENPVCKADKLDNRI